MAFKYVPLLFLTVLVVDGTENNAEPSHLKINPKKRTELVDEAFLEQKDVLLDMLENKLKQIKDKKKKKSDRTDQSNGNGFRPEPIRCDLLPKNIEMKLKGNGMVALGEVDLLLKLGNMGKGTLNMDAVGISNVGKSHLELGVNDGNVYIPGISSLFTGSLFNLCNNSNNNNVSAIEMEPPKLEFGSELSVENKTFETRRKGELNSTIILSTTNATITASNPVNNTEAVTVSLDNSTTTATDNVTSVTGPVNTRNQTLKTAHK